MSFPGITRIIRGDFTLSHGISPSIATLQISPQTNFAVQGGTLTITYGVTQIEFPDCAMDMSSLNAGGDGYIRTVRIVDRRWRWKYGYVIGKYNIRRTDGGINKATEKTPRELATILLKAMGETGFDVNQLPDDNRPAVDWDYANPAEELARLCDAHGCRVVLQLNNLVRICRLGVGAELPSDRIASGGYSFDPPEMPDHLLFVCGPTRWQAKLNLEAVGRDTDGEVKLIKDLSYNPRGAGEQYGWVDQYPETFQALIGTDEGQEKKRALALETVYRWYRIKEPATRDMSIPEYGEIKQISQLLPIDDRLIDQESAVGELYDKPQHAVVEGRFYDMVGDPKSMVNTALGTRYRGSFTIDKERGIVMFSEPVYLLSQCTTNVYLDDGATVVLSENSFAYMPAFLTIECTFSVKDAKTRQPHRHTQERPLTNGKFKTKPKIIKRDDIFLTRRVRYVSLTTSSYGITDLTGFGDATSGIPARTVLNVIENRKPGLGVSGDIGIDTRVNYYLNEAQANLKPKESMSYEYPYIRRIDPDGLIQQVSWSVGGEGARTTASKNNEFDFAVPSYEERRLVEIARRERELKTTFREERETTS